MSKKPNASHNLAMKAAAAAARQNEIEDEPPAPEPRTEPIADPASPIEQASLPGDESLSAPRRGRPRGKRPVEARQTIYLDKARHAALARIAEDRGRSVHSLILEGIDYVVGKPSKAGWQ